MPVERVVVLLHDELCVHGGKAGQGGGQQAEEVALDGRREDPGSARVELRRRGADEQQDERDPLEVGQLALQEEPKQDARGRDLQVSKHLVRRRVHVLEEQKLHVVLNQVDARRQQEQDHRPPVRRHLRALGPLPQLPPQIVERKAKLELASRAAKEEEKKGRKMRWESRESSAPSTKRTRDEEMAGE